MRVLVAVEVRRFLSRRAMRVAAGAMFGLIVAGAVLTFAFSNRDIAGATTRARADAVAEYQACVADAPAGGAAGCEEPDLASIEADPRFHLSSLPDVLANAGANLTVIALVFGASFIGAEWHHRTMMATLTWDPRRARVAVAKIAAGATVTFAAVVAIEIVLSGALIPAAVFRGTTDGTTGAWLAHTIGVGVRVGALAAFAASLGAALAFLARNTAFAIGISFLWIAVLEGIVRGTRPGWTRWLIGENAAAFVGVESTVPGRSGLAAGGLLALYLGAIAWVAVTSFRRRDIA